MKGQKRSLSLSDVQLARTPDLWIGIVKIFGPVSQPSSNARNGYDKSVNTPFTTTKPKSTGKKSTGNPMARVERVNRKAEVMRQTFVDQSRIEIHVWVQFSLHKIVVCKSTRLQLVTKGWALGMNDGVDWEKNDVGISER